MAAEEASDDGAKSAGFRIEAGRLQVTLPTCLQPITNAGDAAAIDDVLSLFRVLRRYRFDRENERSTTARDRRGSATPADVRVGADAGELHWLECALELFDDYRDHGLLRYDRRVISRSRPGRIDWRTTIRRETPCLSGQDAVYIAPFRRSLEAHQDHALTLLHALAIREISDRLGLGAPLDASVGRASSGAIEPWRALGVLRRERSHLFRDRDRHVVRLLERYWTAEPLGRNVVDTGPRDLLWTDRFENVWERMTRTVLVGSRPEGITTRIARGEYQENGRPAGSGLDLRPDFIVRVGPTTSIVFDAKYYTTAKLPGSADVLKQLAYCYFASASWDESRPTRLLNVFLLPTTNPREVIALTGQHNLLNLTERQRSLPLAGDIWIFRLDYRSVARAYLSRVTWPPSQFAAAIDQELGAPH